MPADTMNLIRQGASVVFEQAFDRYARALANRAADLKRKAPVALEANLAAERERLRPRLLEECAGALILLPHNANGDATNRILRVAQAVIEGEPPKLAAERLITMLGVA